MSLFVYPLCVSVCVCTFRESATTIRAGSPLSLPPPSKMQRKFPREISIGKQAAIRIERSSTPERSDATEASTSGLRYGGCCRGGVRPREKEGRGERTETVELHIRIETCGGGRGKKGKLKRDKRGGGAIERVNGGVKTKEKVDPETEKRERERGKWKDEKKRQTEGEGNIGGEGKRDGEKDRRG